MQNPRLASRYAKSILDLSIERGELEEVYADMQWLQSVCKTNKDFVNLLRSPVIKNETKKKIVEAITKGRVSEITAGFNRLLITKNRERVLPEITTAFITAYKVHKKIQTVHLTTAVAISDSMRNAILSQIKKSDGFDKVELQETVDDTIIGGFVLKVGDKLVDASIAYDLKAIAKQFNNNDFIYRIR
jgi:F-type H+-transporting ATPase subunit delta